MNSEFNQNDTLFNNNAFSDFSDKILFSNRMVQNFENENIKVRNNTEREQ